MKKKLTALLTVILATLSILPVDASASSQSKTRLIATCAVPDITIEVTVPASTNAYLNPKRVSVNLGSTITDGQILSDPAYIENFSEVPVSVNVAVTGSVRSTSTLKLSETTTQGSGQTSKLAFIYLQMQAVDDPDKFEAWNSGYDPNQDIVLSTTTKEKSGMITLAQDGEGDCYGLFRLSGDCVPEPTNDPWTTKDSFTAKIVFTFKALPLS